MRSVDLMIRKLRLHTALDDADIEALYALPIRVRELDERTSIARQYDRPNECCLVVRGTISRSKIVESGKRQIMSFHIPGDIPDLESLFLQKMDHDITTVSPAILAFVAHQDLKNLIRTHPAVAQAYWRCTLVDAAIYREWIVNLSVRPAPARLAHLMAELRHRMEAVGLSVDNGFEFPISQAELGEALGITAVHVNRVLQALRSEGLLEMRNNRVTVANLPKLIRYAGFDEVYLHEADGRLQ